MIIVAMFLTGYSVAQQTGVYVLEKGDEVKYVSPFDRIPAPSLPVPVIDDRPTSSLQLNTQDTSASEVTVPTVVPTGIVTPTPDSVQETFSKKDVLSERTKIELVKPTKPSREKSSAVSLATPAISNINTSFLSTPVNNSKTFDTSVPGEIDTAIALATIPEFGSSLNITQDDSIVFPQMWTFGFIIFCFLFIIGAYFASRRYFNRNSNIKDQWFYPSDTR